MESFAKKLVKATDDESGRAGVDGVFKNRGNLEEIGGDFGLAGILAATTEDNIDIAGVWKSFA